MCDLWLNENAVAATPVALVGPRKWTDGDRLMVLYAVWNDKGYSANFNVQCPVCHTNALRYDNPTHFDMVAFCDTCKTGIKQGKGA